MDTAPVERARTDGLVALLVVGSVFALQWPFRLYGINLIDEGAIFQIGHDLLGGARLYTDLVHPAFPGIHWTIAATFWLFGSTFDSARTFGAALFAVVCGTVFLMGRWFVSRRSALALVGVFLAYRVWAYPHWHMLSYSSLGVGLILMAAAVTGAAIARPGSALFGLAGVLAGATVLAKQDIGPLGIATLTLVIAASRPHEAGPVRPPLRAFLAGVAIVGGTSLGYVLWSGMFFDMIDRTILGPLHGLQHFAYQGRPALLPLFAQDPQVRADLYNYAPTILLDVAWHGILASRVYRDTWFPDAALKVVYYLPIAIACTGVALTLIRRLRRGRPHTAAAARFELLVAMALAFWLAFNRPHDWIHLLVLYPPTLLLGAALLAATPPGRWRRFLAVTSMAALLVAMLTSAAIAVRFRQTNDTPVTTAHGVMYATAPQATSLQALVDGLRGIAPAAAPMIAFPYHPLLHYVGDRPRVPPYPHVWPIDSDSQRESTIIAAIDQNPETLVVYTPTQFPHFPRFAEFAPTLYAHLVEHFAVTAVYGGDPAGYTFLLLQRRAPESSMSLLGELVAAPVTITPLRAGGRPQQPLTTPALAEVAWPFTRALRTPLIADGIVTTTLTLRPEAGMHLALAYGFNPDQWVLYPYPHGRFEIVVRANGTEHVVVDDEVYPADDPNDRAWHPVDLDLSPWVDQQPELVLRVTGIASGPPRLDAAGFAAPRLIRPGSTP